MVNHRGGRTLDVLYSNSIYQQSSIATIENKFQQADGEVVQLRENLKQYENLVEDYRDQVRAIFC